MVPATVSSRSRLPNWLHRTVLRVAVRWKRTSGLCAERASVAVPERVAGLATSYVARHLQGVAELVPHRPVEDLLLLFAQLISHSVFLNHIVLTQQLFGFGPKQRAVFRVHRGFG